MKLEVAALLPCGGLTAYTAIMRARPYIRECEDRKGMTGMYVGTCRKLLYIHGQLWPTLPPKFIYPG